MQEQSTRKELKTGMPSMIDRTGKELLIASKQFAEENRLKSWWCFWSTLIIAAVLLALAAWPGLSMLTSISASILSGFVLVRVFVIFHDFFHGAILKDSKLAYWIMYGFGLLVLSPAKGWKDSHDHHHKHNSNQFGAAIGSFPLMTTVEYANASPWRQLGYRLVRSPFIILFGYITSFLVHKTLTEFVKNPIKNRNCGLSLFAHFGLALMIGIYSIKAMLLGMIMPIMIAAAIGTYLFYAQHNFPGMKRRKGHEWDYVYAALHSSSYMKVSPMMQWLTGNIGYHHVHHLNAKIPFYRLPEAMNNMRELQSPVRTSLSVSDIFGCLQLKLWDPATEKLLTFREAKLASGC